MAEEITEAKLLREGVRMQKCVAMGGDYQDGGSESGAAKAGKPAMGGVSAGGHGGRFEAMPKPGY